MSPVGEGLSKTIRVTESPDVRRKKMQGRGRSDSEAVLSFPTWPPEAIAVGSVGFVLGWGENGTLEGKGVCAEESSELLPCEQML